MFFFFFDDSGELVKKESNYTEDTFENIKHIDENGNEFWYARELQKVLEYTEWRNFEKIISKAKLSAKNAGSIEILDFVEVNKIVEAGIFDKYIHDYKLSRYACYLIVQNGDPKKEVIALGQTYFAVKTRQQELIENYDKLSDDKKRLAIREQMVEHNKRLVDAAHDAGVITPQEYATFQNCGYKGLYGGLGMREIHTRKGLKENQKILDYMDYEELAANLFRATQTEAKLRRENIVGTSEANKTHFEVGQKVRQTIADLGGTMPEDLPTPEKSIQQIRKEQKSISDSDQLSLFEQ